MGFVGFEIFYMIWTSKIRLPNDNFLTILHHCLSCVLVYKRWSHYSHSGLDGGNSALKFSVFFYFFLCCWKPTKWISCHFIRVVSMKSLLKNDFFGYYATPFLSFQWNHYCINDFFCMMTHIVYRRTIIGHLCKNWYAFFIQLVKRLVCKNQLS